MAIETTIPEPSISRLCKIYTMLSDLDDDSTQIISSLELGKKLGVGSHSIRKDISFLNETGKSGSGYNIHTLKNSIEDNFGFNSEQNASIIGLGSLGQALISNSSSFINNLRIVAGFDTSINRIETFSFDLPVFPTYDLTEQINRFNISYVIITETMNNIDSIVERIIESGVEGIMNLSSSFIPHSDKIIIRNLDILGEFNLLFALCQLPKKNN